MAKKKAATTTEATTADTSVRSSMTDAEFVKMWQEAESLDVINELYDLGGKAAQSRAIKLRKLGVGLKKFGRGNEKKDIDSLNALAKQFAPKK